MKLALIECGGVLAVTLAWFGILASCHGPMRSKPELVYDKPWEEVMRMKEILTAKQWEGYEKFMEFLVTENERMEQGIK